MKHPSAYSYLVYAGYHFHVKKGTSSGFVAGSGKQCVVKVGLQSAK